MYSASAAGMDEVAACAEDILVNRDLGSHRFCSMEYSGQEK
jgi:hypothetical protein